MTIPDFQTIMLPFLEFSSDGKMHSFVEATDALAKEFKLTDAEIDTLIPSGQQRFANRVGWAKTHLKKAGLIDYPQRGYFQITQRGIDVLKETPKVIDMKFLMQFPEFLEFRKIHQVDTGKEKVIEQSNQLPPEETIDVAYQEIRAGLADDLLDYVIKCSPAFFEKLVVDLLVSMGYGGTHENAARAVGKSGDDGIDGIIDEDKLGLDSIYIQAKRYQKDAKIGAHFIRDFIGALQGFKANKGVFLTTAGFTKEAMNFVSKVQSRVVLIDGKRLANLMIDFGIGVSTRMNYQIKQLDTDYFGEV
jgi:restriction system protein